MAKGHKTNNSHRKRDTEYFEEVLAIDRVTRVVSGGRRLRFRATVIVGNRNGKIGIGVGKANEVMLAIAKAVTRAKKGMKRVAVVNDTIPFPIDFKLKSARIMLMPASEGTGIIAGGAVRKVIEMAGYKNILSKSHGSSNKINASRAALGALEAITAKYVHIEKVELPDTQKPEGMEDPNRPQRRENRRLPQRRSAPKAEQTESTAVETK